LPARFWFCHSIQVDFPKLHVFTERRRVAHAEVCGINPRNSQRWRIGAKSHDVRETFPAGRGPRALQYRREPLLNRVLD
jgi:hypothetical protein